MPCEQDVVATRRSRAAPLRVSLVGSWSLVSASAFTAATKLRRARLRAGSAPACHRSSVGSPTSGQSPSDRLPPPAARQPRSATSFFQPVMCSTSSQIEWAPAMGRAPAARRVDTLRGVARNGEPCHGSPSCSRSQLVDDAGNLSHEGISRSSRPRFSHCGWGPAPEARPLALRADGGSGLSLALGRGH